MKETARKVEFDVDPEVAAMTDEAIKEGRTLDLTSDIVFKSLFSKETKETNAALRYLIASVTKQNVTKVKVLNPEITPQMITGKKVVLDVRCEFDDGRQADVEMQKEDEGPGYDLLKRMTAYNAGQMASQLNKGELWNELNTCYQITILGYKYFDDDGYHHTHVLYDREYKTENACFQLHTLELPKLKPLLGKPVEQLSDDEICGILIMYGGNPKYRDYLETLSNHKEEVAMAVTELDKMSKDRKEWEMNFERLKTRCDYYSFKSIAEKNGREQGRTKGLEEGMKAGMKEGMEKGLAKGLSQAKIEDARNLKQLGVSVEIILKATGLTAEEIKKL
jgi:predicted transposase/invertase (TIGR01784 family)